MHWQFLFCNNQFSPINGIPMHKPVFISTFRHAFWSTGLQNTINHLNNLRCWWRGWYPRFAFKHSTIKNMYQSHWNSITCVCQMTMRFSNIMMDRSMTGEEIALNEITVLWTMQSNIVANYIINSWCLDKICKGTNVKNLDNAQSCLKWPYSP